jgi:hypothetical protein
MCVFILCKYDRNKMSNYNFVEPGVTRLAERELGTMSIRQLKDKIQEFSDQIGRLDYAINYTYSRSPSDIDRDKTQIMQLIAHIQRLIAKKESASNRAGGRRTRRNKKVKKAKKGKKSRRHH